MSETIGSRVFRVNTNLSTRRSVSLASNIDAPKLPGQMPIPSSFNDPRVAKDDGDVTASVATMRAGMAKPVDQTDCGQCYIVATLQHLHDTLAVSDPNIPNLNPLYVLMNMQTGCGGGSPIDVNGFVSVHGVIPDDVDDGRFSLKQYENAAPDTLQRDIPGLKERMGEFFRGDKSSSTRFFKSKPQVSVFGEMHRNDPNPEDHPESMDTIKKYILTQGSVVFAMPIRNDFQAYWSNGGNERPYVTDPSSPMIGGHAIVCVGWNDSVPIPYWVVRNSWGTTGPLRNGYGRIAMFWPGGHNGQPEFNRELWLGSNANALGGIMAIHAEGEVQRKSILLPFEMSVQRGLSAGYYGNMLYPSVIIISVLSTLLVVMVVLVFVISKRNKRRFSSFL